MIEKMNFSFSNENDGIAREMVTFCTYPYFVDELASDLNGLKEDLIGFIALKLTEITVRI